ncbi:uncharacterized protein LOC118735410 [Rhagoletis pomonella]|uniref:uncharacterized protein LOC118735410 n=1 Tax=Rhagoletis pomonella TaxID=28610 RepID=UPI0017829D04|nr:uncharacterized protein LOC118735410 [Rhagoletis pomonella]
MEIHPDLSKGLLKTPDAKTVSTNLWKKLACDLNAAGPPMREVAGSKKVWADYKTHLKAKMRRNKHSISGTGGGRSNYCSLTQLKQKVSELLSMEESMSGMVGTLEFGAAQTASNTHIETSVEGNTGESNSLQDYHCSNVEALLARNKTF